MEVRSKQERVLFRIKNSFRNNKFCFFNNVILLKKITTFDELIIVFYNLSLQIDYKTYKLFYFVKFFASNTKRSAIFYLEKTKQTFLFKINIF